MDVQQSRKFRIILACLLASLFLHGFFVSVAIRCMPKQLLEQPATAHIVMIDLAAQAHQKNGDSLPVQALPTAPANKSRQVTQAVTVQAATPFPVSSTSPEKRSDHLQDARHLTPDSPARGKTAITSPLSPSTSEQTAAGHSQPQELTFGSASGPSFIKQALPVYPIMAKRRGREGVVLLRLSISETGHLTQIEILEDPGFGFGEAALEAVRNSSFSPAHHNGKPIAMRATLPIRFTLR